MHICLAETNAEEEQDASWLIKESCNTSPEVNLCQDNGIDMMVIGSNFSIHPGADTLNVPA